MSFDANHIRTFSKCISENPLWRETLKKQMSEALVCSEYVEDLDKFYGRFSSVVKQLPFKQFKSAAEEIFNQMEPKDWVLLAKSATLATNYKPPSEFDDQNGGIEEKKAKLDVQRKKIVTLGKVIPFTMTCIGAAYIIGAVALPVFRSIPLQKTEIQLAAVVSLPVLAGYLCAFAKYIQMRRSHAKNYKEFMRSHRDAYKAFTSAINEMIRKAPEPESFRLSKCRVRKAKQATFPHRL